LEIKWRYSNRSWNFNGNGIDMVGLSELKKYTDVIKKCQMTVKGKYCYFQLSGLSTFDFLDILNYKSWVYKTYQRNVTIRYVNMIKKLEKGSALVRTSVGFGPLLLRFLRSRGVHIREEDVEAYRSRLVVFPDIKINLYDFQNRMVGDWLNVGGIGVVKSPTGSGKCPRRDTLISTNRGLIKIEDLVKKKEQTTIDDHFIEDDKEIEYIDHVVTYKGSKSGFKKFKIIDRYDMGIEDLISIKTNIGLKVSGTKEHPIMLASKGGKLKFVQLRGIRKGYYVAIPFNTQTYNDVLELKYHYRTQYTGKIWKLENTKIMNEDIARLLGYVIAEGNANIHHDKPSSFLITNYDKEIQDDVMRICNNLGLDISYRYEEDKNEGNPIGVFINSIMFTDFMYYLGYKHLAQNKEVPWSILQADKKCQIAFIRGLFDGDGTVYYGSDKDFVQLGSSSLELCRQIQIMFLNMGIISRLDRKKGATLQFIDGPKTYDESYRLTLYGEDVLKYTETISFGLTRKKEILDRCVEKIKSRGRWSSIVYPFLDPLFNTLYERLKVIGKNGILKDGKKFSSSYDYLKYYSFDKEIWSYINGERIPSRSTLEKILYIFSPIKEQNDKNNETLRQYGMKENIDQFGQIYDYIQSLYDNFIFDQVEEISEERDHVYDITVEDVHSYIGNGLINHNTIVGCKAIKEIGRKTLILVHTSDLLINVWNDSLVKTFGPGIMEHVGIIGGGLTDNDRMAMKIGARTNDFDENVRKDVVVATFQTLNNKLDELSKYKFGLMIVDECHHIPATMFRKVNAAIRAPYKMGLSATTKRLDGLEKEVFSSLGDIQSSVTIRELINKGILAEPRFQSPVIVDKGIIEEIESCGLGGLNLSRFVKKTSASSKKKMDYIINICKNIEARNRKFLLFTDYVHAEDVYVRDLYADSLLKEGIKVSIIDQGMSSDERSTVFKFLDAGQIDGIVFGKLGSEGINILNVDAVIMANGIKSPITYCQRVGRAMRKTPEKQFCDIYEILLDTPMELRWSEYNFAEYKMEGFQKLVYKVE
jgi:superfamily II DNA or RNA helicase/intein/homing endonuclease